MSRIDPDFVAVARWLLANGWCKNEPGSLVYAETGERVIAWDWEKPGAEASWVAPEGATFTVEVSSRDGERWRDDLVVKPQSVRQVIRHLQAMYLLPQSLPWAVVEVSA